MTYPFVYHVLNIDGFICIADSNRSLESDNQRLRATAASSTMKRKKGVVRSQSIRSVVRTSTPNDIKRAPSVQHYKLHATLEDFVTLSDAPTVAAVLQRKDGGGMEALQAEIGKDPNNKKAAAALRKGVGVFVSAMHKEIASRLSSVSDIYKDASDFLVCVCVCVCACACVCVCVCVCGCVLFLEVLNTTPTHRVCYQVACNDPV